MARRTVRDGWLDTVRDASDLALLGVLTTLGALGVVTIGAAVATASAALHHWREHGYWPSAGDTVRRYVRALLPGVPATLLALAVTALLGWNLSAFGSGAVPGGTALTVVTLLLVAALSGYAALVVVEVGRDEAGWRAAARRAERAVLTRPVALLALAGVTMLAGVLAVTVIPILTPILVGYLLFAQHAVTHKLLPHPT